MYAGRLFKQQFAITSALVAALIIFAGCDSDEVAGLENDEIADVIIAPDGAQIPVGEQRKFSAMVVTVQGDTVAASEFDLAWDWFSSDTSIFTVQDDGTAEGVSPGEAFCIIEHRAAGASKAAGAAFVGRDSVVVMIF